MPGEVDDLAEPARSHVGVFGLTVLTFFIAKIGDKTQIATVMPAARYNDLVWVTAALRWHDSGRYARRAARRQSGKVGADPLG